MAHILKAYLHLLGTEPIAVPIARECYLAASRLPANGRERGHIEAIGHLVDGRWHAAGMTLEDVSIEYPRDALALQAGHVIDFFPGDTRMLRDRIASALPAWHGDMPGYHAVLGITRSVWKKPAITSMPRARDASRSRSNRETAGVGIPSLT
jgi:hypothetical protein